MLKQSEILINARKIIQNPDNWTKGTLARDKDNNEIEVTNPNATCFCMIGAIYKSLDVDHFYAVTKKVNYEIIDELITFDNTLESIHIMNDGVSQTHAGMLEFMDSMIEHFKSKEEK